MYPASEELYKYYTKSERKIKYMEEDIKFENIKVSQKDGTVTIIPSREDSFDRLCENGVSFQSDEKTVEDYIVQKVTLEKAFEKLSLSERRIIEQIFYEEKTERQLAKIYNTTQQNINKMKQAILCKLNEFLIN